MGGIKRVRVGVQLIHEIKTVSHDNSDALTVNRDVYINGHFYAQQEWKLNRV